MSKLIRVHTTNKDGTFDAIYKDNIVIEPNSEIALQSCAIAKSVKTLNISGVNNIFTFQIQETNGNNHPNAGQPAVKTIITNIGLYNRDNILGFLTDLQDKMNSSLHYRNSKEFGTQINISINDSNKLQIDMPHSNFERVSDVQQSPNAVYKNMITTNNVLKNSGLGSANINNSYVYYAKPWTKGCGVLRVKVRDLTQVVGVPANSNGFIMGLFEEANYSKFTDGSFTIDDLDYAIKIKGTKAVDPAQFDFIQIRNPSLNAGGGHDATGFTDTASRPTKLNDDAQNVQNDVYDIVMSEGSITLRKNIEVGGIAVAPVLLDGNGTPYDRSKVYYGIIIILGATGDCGLVRVEAINDPFGTNHATFNANIHTNSDDAPTTELSAPRKNNRPTIYNFTFPDTQTANYFGFTIPEQNPDRFLTPEGIFISDNVLSSIISTDTFILELENIPLESYDSISGGQKNILAVIPVNERVVDGDTGIIDFEPNEKYYISLKNIAPLTLRNIKARFTTENFDPIPTEGISTLSLVVRKKLNLLIL
jgi:hypothetical protein